MARCLSVKNKVLVYISPFSGNFTRMVVIVLAVSSTMFTLNSIFFSLTIRSSSLNSLYATKQMQIWASILHSVKWNIGRISNVPFDMRKARSTTHNP